LVKHSQPFGKNCQKTAGGIFFDLHCIVLATVDTQLI